MDKIQAASNIIIKINQFQDGELNDYELIHDICAYFDMVKGKALSNADMQFLFYIANQIGIPQYFDTLVRFGQSDKLGNFSLGTFSDCLKESLLYTSDSVKLHKYQKDILDRFEIGRLNRFFLSASTSFGKTFVVYEVLRKMKYKNVILLFPSIALLSENLEKIYSDKNYSWINDTFKTHTISNVQELADNNLFLYTPERYLSFLDFKQEIDFDFVFVDEVYKMDNEYLVDEEMKENERDVAYRLALYYILQNNSVDVLLAGPYIEFSCKNAENYNPSFDRFLYENKIELLDYNRYEIVNQESEVVSITNKKERFKAIIKDRILSNGENVIVYCYSRSQAEQYAKLIIEDENFDSIDTSAFNDFLLHLKRLFNKSQDWVVLKALKKGVGIHHGLVPKYIQKEIIHLFNKGFIKILISTTTITEGVNTTAKNVLVLSHKKGNKQLKTFDALNIAGRAGRFLQHYSGHIFLLDKDFDKIKKGEGDPIKHKNYDENSPKTEIDIYHTHEKYLNKKNRADKQMVDLMQQQSGIPEEILNQFKVISKKEKIEMYSHISNLSVRELNDIRQTIQYYTAYKRIKYDDKGIERIIQIVLPYVKHKQLRRMMTESPKNKSGLILNKLIFSYFKNGFKGMVDYKSRVQGNPIDKAIKETAEFIYNVLKYQVVKYFGAFNLLYKYHISIKENKPFEGVTGIDSILLRMEYNANTECGRKASDYGVPQNIIDYYDEPNPAKKNLIKQNFDSYEVAIFNKIAPLIEKG